MTCPDVSVVGLDIGGANLKLSDATGNSSSIAFPMWIDSSKLAKALGDMLRSHQAATGNATDHVAVTLTGEMADCFESRRTGVAFILDQLTSVVDGSMVSVYTTDGRWFSVEEAKADPWLVAASNWHALANWIGNSQVVGESTMLVVDIGSTTTDVVPVSNGCIITDARTDRERMQKGQLVYTGAQRTPLAALLSTVAIGSSVCPLVSERFATIDDAYIVLRETSEDESDYDTADGRSRTFSHSASRLARMIGEDRETIGDEVVRQIANQAVEAQAAMVATAIKRNLALVKKLESHVVVLSGHGHSLFDRAVKRLSYPGRIVRLSDFIGPEASRCAPALAVAWLLQRSCATKHTSEKASMTEHSK